MNAIVLMAIGAKYEAILEATRDQFEQYAQKCGAQLEICRTAPDPSMQGHLLTQKMLIPKIYSQYEWIAFLDLDVVISKKAPSIFESIENAKAFGAVLEPRNTQKFLSANHEWFNQSPEDIISLEDRFKNEGFEITPKLIGTINGGVWLAKPSIVGDLFANFYWQQQGSNAGYTFYEEIPMAFITQNADLFFPLDEKFNDQLIYFSCEKNARFNYFIIKTQEKINQLLKRFIPKRESFLFLPPYISLIETTLDSSFILHFAGGYPIPKKLKNSLSFHLYK
jgi:hypothetical protein